MQTRMSGPPSLPWTACTAAAAPAGGDGARRFLGALAGPVVGERDVTAAPRQGGGHLLPDPRAAADERHTALRIHAAASGHGWRRGRVRHGRCPGPPRAPAI